jgi:hypothetical protein
VCWSEGEIFKGFIESLSPRSVRLFVFLVVVFVVLVVFDVVAVVLWGEGRAFFGVGNAADGAAGNVHLRGVGGSDLQAVEEQAGAFRVELIGGESLEDVDEGELDGRGVLDGREVERCVFPSPRVGAGADGIGTVVDGLDAASFWCWERSEATVLAAVGVTGGLALALAIMQAGMEVSVFTNAVSRLHLRGAAFLNGKAASAVLITVHFL